MNPLHDIDLAIETLTDKAHLNLFDRWREEYTQRYHGTSNRTTFPKKHSGYAGFESNLHALLFHALQSNDPHSEWPYSSYIDNSSDSVDIHIVKDASEVWIELGMYASGEKKKYLADVDKLAAVIDRSAHCIGIILHFEIYERGVVGGIFQNIQSRHQEKYAIDIKPFRRDARTMAYRLSIQKNG